MTPDVGRVVAATVGMFEGFIDETGCIVNVPPNATSELVLR